MTQVDPSINLHKYDEFVAKLTPDNIELHKIRATPVADLSGNVLSYGVLKAVLFDYYRSTHYVSPIYLPTANEAAVARASFVMLLKEPQKEVVLGEDVIYHADMTRELLKNKDLCSRLERILYSSPFLDPPVRVLDESLDFLMPSNLFQGPQLLQIISRPEMKVRYNSTTKDNKDHMLQYNGLEIDPKTLTREELQKPLQGIIKQRLAFLSHNTPEVIRDQIRAILKDPITIKWDISRLFYGQGNIEIKTTAVEFKQESSPFYRSKETNKCSDEQIVVITIRTKIKQGSFEDYFYFKCQQEKKLDLFEKSILLPQEKDLILKKFYKELSEDSDPRNKEYLHLFGPYLINNHM